MPWSPFRTCLTPSDFYSNPTSTRLLNPPNQDPHLSSPAMRLAGAAALLLWARPALATSPTKPCESPEALSFPFCDATLTHDERITDLIARLDVPAKVGR